MELTGIGAGRLRAASPTGSGAAWMARQLSIVGLVVPLFACSLPTAPAPVSASPSSVQMLPTGPDETIRTRRIVNVDARVNSTRRPVSVVLEAGTYLVTPIGTEQGGTWDGWNAWDATTCTEPTGCSFTSPTTQMGWLSSYVLMSPSIAAATIEGRPLAPVSLTEGSSALYYYVSDGMVYPDARSALSAGQGATFTIVNSGAVAFSIADEPTVDNVGGISLEVVGRSPSGQ